MLIVRYDTCSMRRARASSTQAPGSLSVVGSRSTSASRGRVVQRASSGVGQVAIQSEAWRGDGLGEHLPRGRRRGDDRAQARLAEDGRTDPGGQQQGQVGPRREGVGVVALAAGDDVVRRGRRGRRRHSPAARIRVAGRESGARRAEKVAVSLGGHLAAAEEREPQGPRSRRPAGYPSSAFWWRQKVTDAQRSCCPGRRRRRSAARPKTRAECRRRSTAAGIDALGAPTACKRQAEEVVVEEPGPHGVARAVVEEVAAPLERGERPGRPPAGPPRRVIGVLVSRSIGNVAGVARQPGARSSSAPLRLTPRSRPGTPRGHARARSAANRSSRARRRRTRRAARRRRAAPPSRLIRPFRPASSSSSSGARRTRPG